MTSDDHAERMALFLVELAPILAATSKSKAERARALVADYRKSQHDAYARRAARAQRPLFPEPDVPSVPYAQQDTSIEAAGSVAPVAAALRERVFEALISKPDTDEGIGLRLGLSGNTVRPRRVELVQAGRVMDSGERRATRSGRTAIVWAPRLQAGALA